MVMSLGREQTKSFTIPSEFPLLRGTAPRARPEITEVSAINEGPQMTAAAETGERHWAVRVRIYIEANPALHP